ncbi:hypothetical protein [Knoellia sp. LjRoot47]|uniref:hypothetical protein n=1 Tax=Knoellia sp. LjRoot47 TaxID=3342330 RepID=UPI003ED11EE0
MRTNHSLARAADRNPSVSGARTASIAATATLAVLATLAAAGCSTVPNDASAPETARTHAPTTDAVIVADGPVMLRPGTPLAPADGASRVVSWGGGGNRPHTGDPFTVRVNGASVTVIPTSDSGSLTIGLPASDPSLAPYVVTASRVGFTSGTASTVTHVHVIGDEITADTVTETPTGSGGSGGGLGGA